jgi:hypothetical protein
MRVKNITAECRARDSLRKNEDIGKKFGVRLLIIGGWRWLEATEDVTQGGAGAIAIHLCKRSRSPARSRSLFCLAGLPRGNLRERAKERERAGERERFTRDFSFVFAQKKFTQKNKTLEKPSPAP